MEQNDFQFNPQRSSTIKISLASNSSLQYSDYNNTCCKPLDYELKPTIGYILQLCFRFYHSSSSVWVISTFVDRALYRLKTSRLSLTSS